MTQGADPDVSSRRVFLKNSGLLLGSLLAPRTLRAETCVATTPDAYGLGPFYLPDSPLRTTTLAEPGEPGEPFALSGVVSDCHGPLEGVRLEVWQANAAGCYPGVPEFQNCAPVPGVSDVGRLRGTFITDAQGRYGFLTVMPKGYVDGSTTRTAHIHFRVTLASPPDEAVELITQLYFQGSDYLEEDDGAEDAMATSGLQRIIARTPREGGGTQGVFDIVLPGPVSLMGRHPRAPEILAGFDAMVVRRGREIRFVLPVNRLPGTVTLRVSAPDGREVHVSRHTGRAFAWDAARVPAGIYAAELRSSHSKSREVLRLKID